MIFREAGSATRSFLDHLLQTHGLDIKPRLEFEGNETVKQAVMAGMGISFLSAHACQLELEAGKLALLKVKGTPKWLDWCIVSRREQTMPPIRQAFKDFLMAEGTAHTACKLDFAPAPADPAGAMDRASVQIEAVKAPIRGMTSVTHQGSAAVSSPRAAVLAHRANTHAHRLAPTAESLPA
jgi:hypothetical protein